MGFRFRPCVALLVIVVAAQWTVADDHFLTIGGGGSPDNNQVSLEKNILYFRTVLAGSGLGSAAHDVFFSDGDDPGLDVQYVDPEFEPPVLNVLLARLNGNEHELYYQYRTHGLPDVRGPSTRQSLTSWFADTGSKLKQGDRLFIYFTGHGGRGRPQRNTTLALWNDASMPVKEFVTLLDRVPADVPVVIVMVQCHAGGFADVLFDRGTPPNLSNANRCGFFATLHNRQAAGCTADIDEENYHEYSTFFFAALHGRSRTGEAVARPDYDRDGKVSFAEAHAYVQIESDTIDIPLATSDVFLRQFSDASVENPKGLVTVDDPFERLLEVATAAQRAVLVALSEQLEVSGDGRVADARAMARGIEQDRRKIGERKTRLTAEYNRIRARIRGRLKSRWPELVTAYHPKAQEVLERDGERVQRFIEAHESFKRWEQLDDELGGLDEEDTALERRWVKVQRLLRCVETVALAANLERVASDETCQRFRELLAAESGSLRSPSRAR
jgi:hypothetical protein